MTFKPTKLPSKARLDLFEAVTHIALREAISVKALAQLDYPSARPYRSEIEQALKLCRDEAGDQAKYSSFLALVGQETRGSFNPPSSAQLRHCEASWPPSGRLLHDVAEQWEQAQAEDENKLREAEPALQRAFASGMVTFSGARDDHREDIDVGLFAGDPQINIYNDTIMAPLHTSGTKIGKTLKWTDVRVKTASLLAYLKASPYRTNPNLSAAPR